MPCIILIDIKRSPKSPVFGKEASQIMQMKGYQLIGNNPITFFNAAATIPPAEITSALKMMKAIQTYSQVVKKIIYSTTFKVG